jgi:cation diffusion facilitator family transporter
VPIRFAEALPIAILGLGVNVVSAWLLSGGDHHHGHGTVDNGHDHAETYTVTTRVGPVGLSVFEDGVPPRFRLQAQTGLSLAPGSVWIETVRPDGARQRFTLVDRGTYLGSVEEVPEPHAFTAHVHLGEDEGHAVVFEEPDHAPEHLHGAAHRDNNMRAAVIHVIADAAVSVLVIVGLLLARAFGWLWMDPLAGIIGACVIASWSYGLIRDTGAILLDMNPDRRLADKLRQTIESDGDTLADLLT